MPDEIQIAVDECAAARAAGAAPLLLSAEAVAELAERSKGQFRTAFPQIPGGWPAVRAEVLSASELVGTIAKAIARFQDPKAQEITVEQARLARTAAEKACKLRLSDITGKPTAAIGVTEGLACG